MRVILNKEISSTAIPCNDQEQSFIQGVLDGLIANSRRLNLRSEQDERELDYCTVCNKRLSYNCCNKCAGFPCGQCYLASCNSRRLEAEAITMDDVDMSMIGQEGKDRNLQSVNEYLCLSKWTKVQRNLVKALVAPGSPLSPQCLLYATDNMKVDYTFTA